MTLLLAYLGIAAAVATVGIIVRARAADRGQSDAVEVVAAVGIGLAWPLLGLLIAFVVIVEDRE